MACFTYMKRIEKTIKEGGYLTSELYVPKYIWFQKEGAIKDIDLKIKHFNNLKLKLLGLKIIY